MGRLGRRSARLMRQRPHDSLVPDNRFPAPDHLRALKMTVGHIIWPSAILKGNIMVLNGKWVLVTGASGGLGAQFAELLAERGANLVLAARSSDRLAGISTDLKMRFGVEVVTEAVDLAEDRAATGLFQNVQRRGIAVDILVNNAGQGLHGNFVDQSAEATEAMLRLNIMGLTALTHTVAADMVSRGGGHILLVSSLTAFMPAPTYAAYAASKAYVRQFGEALHTELKPRNVVVTVVSPGLMDTGFLSAAGQQASKSMTSAMTSPRMVAKVGLDALFDGRQGVVVGWTNRVVAGASRFIPRNLQTKLMANALNN